jgi:sugar/nucleoside kinase (ribokinase family)
VDVLVRGFEPDRAFEREMTDVEGITLAVGGDAVNQAIALTRLGLDAKLICSAGRDNAGFFLRETIASTGADISGIYLADGYQTGVSIVMISGDGQRKFITPFTRDRPDYLPYAETACVDASVVSIASLMLRPFVTPANVLRIARPASERKSVVCADVVAHGGFCSFEELRPAMPFIDYIFPNEEEGAFLTGRESLDGIADSLLAVGVKNVVIKIGSRGCFLKNGETRLIVPAFDAPAVDTTGAGDNFAAGFIKSLLDGRSPRECCLYANAAAGVAVGAVGANTGVKSASQIDDFMASHRQQSADVTQIREEG